MKGGVGASSYTLPGKRRWRGLVIAVLGLVFLSMLVPLVFLLGLHNGFHSASGRTLFLSLDLRLCGQSTCFFPSVCIGSIPIVIEVSSFLLFPYFLQLGHILPLSCLFSYNLHCTAHNISN